MKYKNIIKGRFIRRPNRFIAMVDIDGKTEACHVKNTGRCRELLTDNAEVFLEISSNSNRKTKYDLVGVVKNGNMINMDSYAPNIAFGEFLRDGNIFFDAEIIKSEYKYGNSRFDFYVKEKNGQENFIEVKGVTLENDGVVMFPDAPTERGVKHINELIGAARSGYGAYIVFIIQMAGVKYFTPNRETHAEFADALLNASQNGVKSLAYDCVVGKSEMNVNKPVEIKLSKAVC